MPHRNQRRKIDYRPFNWHFSENPQPFMPNKVDVKGPARCEHSVMVGLYCSVCDGPATEKAAVSTDVA